MSDRANVLVVANRTTDSPDLIAELKQRAAHSPVRFTLLVPATPKGLAWAADMKAGEPEAERRAKEGLLRMRVAGLEVEKAMVGDPDPVAAAGDALRGDVYDEVIVSTFPRGISRWLRISLPQRLRRITGVPVTHIAARSGSPHRTLSAAGVGVSVNDAGRQVA
jgi:hypothetical protein